MRRPLAALPFALALVSMPLLPGVLAPPSARAAPPARERGSLPPVQRDRVYARAGDRALRLDLYLPVPGEAPAPVVVWIHGGGWRMGSKTLCPLAWLRREGFAVASVAYRFSQEARFPAQLHDVKAAVRWLRANAQEHGLDPARIGVAGASAGGHLAALLGTTGDVPALEGTLGEHVGTSSRVAAVYDLFGPTDLVRIHRDADRDGKLPRGMDAVAQLLGEEEEGLLARAALASPVTHVSPGDAPFLIVHGDEDPLVPLVQSVRLHERLRAAGVPSTLQVLEDTGHGGLGFFAEPERRRMLDFFRLHLVAPTTPAERDAAARILEAARPGPHAVTRVELELETPDAEPLPLAVTWPRADALHPVLIFSHGAGGSRRGYAPLVEHLASHGWTVIQPTHRDSRRREGGDAGGNPFRHWASRVDDVKRVLDHLGALEAALSDMEGRLDPTRIAVGGHSFGAHTTQLLAGATTRAPGPGARGRHADPRPRAFLLISPQGRGDLLDADSWKGIERPLMVITGTEDHGRNGQPFVWRTEPYAYAPPGDKHLALLVGADHGFGGISGARRVGIRRDPAMVDRVRALSLLFLEATVRDDAAARAALDPEVLAAALGPEVRFASR